MTGGDTHHYTISDTKYARKKASSIESFLKDIIHNQCYFRLASSKKQLIDLRKNSWLVLARRKLLNENRLSKIEEYSSHDLVRSNKTKILSCKKFNNRKLVVLMLEFFYENYRIAACLN